MTKTLMALALILVLGLSACAQLPLVGGLIGQRVSVTVPTELPFPDTVTLQLAGNAAEAARVGNLLMGALGQGSLEDRLGRALAGQAGPLRRAGARVFREQLEAAHLFGSLVDEGGNVGFSIGVARWGIAYDPAAKTYVPVLDLEATLTEPHLGVVWKGQRSAAQLSADGRRLVGKIDLAVLAGDPTRVQNLMGIVTKDLSAQLMDDLRRHPPLSQFGAAAQ